MSVNTIILNTGQQMIVNFDLSKIFIGENRYNKGDFTNSTYDPISMSAGTVLGRIAATGKLVPLASGAVDGSQYVVGILAEDVIVDDGETRTLFYCEYGDVVEAKLILDGTDTLDTIIEDRRIRDRIAGDTVGIRIRATDEMSGYDNQ